MVTKIYLPAMRAPDHQRRAARPRRRLIGTLLAETKLSNRGIGFLVIQAYSTFDMPQMYALLIVLFVIAIGANALIGRARRARRPSGARKRILARECPMIVRCNRYSSRRSALKLPTHREPYYAGKWQKPATGRYADTINPGTGESLGKVVDGTVADAEAAIAAAKAAFKEWRRVPPLERAQDAARDRRRAAQERRRACHDRRRRLRQPLCRDGARRHMRGAAQLDFFAGLVTEMKGASIPMGPDVVNFSVREPLGVVGAHHSVQPSVHVRRRQVGARRSPPATPS